MNRRSLLGSTLLALTALPLEWLRSIRTALADDKTWRHGVSSFGDLKYSAGFRHFEYVNADAPKGGTARLIALGTFDSFNAVIAGVKGSLAAGIDLIYETLLVSSLDEVSSGYGLLAEAVSFPADFSSALQAASSTLRATASKPAFVSGLSSDLSKRGWSRHTHFPPCNRA